MEENEVQQSAVDNEGRWYFTKEILKNTPSKKCGVSSKEELVLRQRAAHFIQNMGEKLKVNQLCINTAIVFMHRTCMFRSFKKLRWDSLAVAAVFVAAKTEDQQRKVEDVVRLAYKCLHKGDLDPRSQHFLTKRCELISHELDLLKILGCDFNIYHPHVYIAVFMGKIKASKDLGQMSYSMATQSLLLTTMCLQYKPTVVACFCIHLVSKLKNLKVDSCIKDKEWYHCIDESVTPELLEELTKEFSAVLEKSPYWLPLKRGPEDNKDGHSSQSKNNEEIVGRVKPMDDVCKESMKENIPPMPSTSSALCDNSLKIEGKLPADFLENLYAATVEPVTQSTTLEKPKSGQRRTISLAKYREKQGKKKLEHKDLLAVTTAATVNNFPPPVTSMVSVLKPNVPDKRYMPKSEKPIMTKSEKPIMTKSEKPIMTKLEKPIMTKLEKPIMTKSEKPIMTKSEKLIMTESEKPIMTESEKPIMTTQEMKVVTHEEKHLPHETLAMSKEVNQRIPGKSNHIKLPADFLENPYAATVEPVTQSTTLEKPKSGQRRIISLATYREKQGKKKLEHKDLLAVTTAATVNNFPPPVTSMVSVLKPNVPDKPYMPKSEKPIMTQSEKPIITKSEKPIMTKSEKPIMTKSEKPIMTKSEKPIMTKSEKPTMTESEKPIMTESEKPIMTESEKPIMTESEKPIMTESEKPIMTTQEMKVVTHEEKHLPHETLATSKEVNQRIPAKSNHIKLPADFLENPYAATVEPVTQSTTLEKPKSGQRRTISLATYREKQGKKKLEHKDLLAVTTAATVNNFPPPVTSMVSVLKPNVPDKPYMPKSEKPIMTQSEKPIITKSEKPIMTKSEKPIMTKSEKPIMTKSEKPIMTKSEKPIMTKSEKPTMTESEKPIMTESEKPIMTESEKPIMTESEKPIMTESEKPIMTTQEMKVVTHEEKHLPHETLATSKEVNQRIPAKSNHIKLPADFLENPYAATVEPVTQSTTLEKPKSGQRRTISLATYREKQGKKKLEHKDLLAVTTAATVNNFPPPVTSMVSVLKPNVPDKRYMPKSEKPIMTQSEKPIMTKSEKLIMTKSEKPIMTKSEKPIMTKSEKPIMTKSEKPIMTKSEKPIMTKSEKPIMTKSEKPIMTKSEKTIMTESEKPIMTESEKPTMTESEKPIMTKSEKPIMTESEKPIMTTEEMKVVTHQEKHLPNETLSTSKEVNQRIPGKSNHIKLPFDFLENPYAATVEPVTQSTTLEKPKSGQRRIISLATYREKQGKKKLEHKDLLAVTTAATVNNFPPPVTSMVSVLKLNVPDKRYMPKSEKPIMTKCEKPIMTKSEKPIMTKSEKPIMTKSEKPIMTKSEKPIMTESEKPITTESEKPITTESEKPIMTESEKPIMTTQEMKVVTHQKKHLPHQTLATSKEVNQRIPGKSNHKNLTSSSHLDAVPVEKITHLIPKATVSPMPQVNHQPAPKVSVVQPIVRVHPKKKVPKIAPEVIRTNDSFMLLTRVDQSQYEKQIPSDTKSGQQNALPLNASSKGNVLPSVQRTLSRHAKPEPAFLNREKDMTNTDDHSHFQRKSIINVVLPNNYNGIQHSTQGIIPKQSPSCDPMKANGSKIPEQPDKNTGSASASRKAEHASRKRDRSPSSKDHISWSSGKSAKYPKVGGVTNTSLSNPNSVHLNIVKQSDLNVICNYPAQLPYVMPPSNAQPYFQPFHPYPMAPMNPPYGCPPPYFQPFRPYPMVPLNPPYGYPPPLPPQSHLTNSAPPLPRDPYPIVPMNLPYGYPLPLPPQSHSMNSAPPLPRDPPPPLPPLPPSM